MHTDKRGTVVSEPEAANSKFFMLTACGSEMMKQIKI